MRIGVVSDTHSLRLPAKMLADFKNVDMIIHAGDICESSTLKELQALGHPLKAVCGNMDDMSMRKKLPVKEIFEVEGIKIGLAHGHQGDKRDALSNVQSIFKDDAVDVVIFGHSHKALNEKIGKTLFFNPGSPNDVVKAMFFSYGILNIENSKVKAEIVKI